MSFVGHTESGNPVACDGHVLPPCRVLLPNTSFSVAIQNSGAIGVEGRPPCFVATLPCDASVPLEEQCLKLLPLLPAKTWRGPRSSTW